MVNEQEVQIPTPDGTTDGVLYSAENGQPQPGVLFLTDIMGIRESQRGMSRRIAEWGYTVLMPNIFYRTSKPPVIELPVNFADEKTTQRIRQLSAPVTPEAAERDGSAYVDFLSSNSAVSPAPIALVGLCFSGSFAVRTAAARPDRVGLAVSFHGGRLVTDDASSPHLLLPKIKARLYFGHAENDRGMPQEAIDKLNNALAEWGGKYESEVYQGAPHGWTVPDSHYNQPQAERAMSKLHELLSANR